MSSETKVYVANLTMETEEQDLMQIFKREGKILEVKIKLKTHEKYAFVNFDRQDEALSAIQNLNGSELLGNRIKCELAMGDKKDKKCFNCGKVGHFAKYCRDSRDRYRDRRYRRSRSRSRSDERGRRYRYRSRSGDRRRGRDRSYSRDRDRRRDRRRRVSRSSSRSTSRRNRR